MLGEILAVAGLLGGLSGLAIGMGELARLGVALCLLAPLAAILSGRTTEDRWDGVESLVALAAVAFGGHLLGEAACLANGVEYAVLAGCALRLGSIVAARRTAGAAQSGRRCCRYPACMAGTPGFEARTH